MTWKLTYKHKLPTIYKLGHPKFSIDEYIEFFFNGRYIGHIIFYCLNSETMTLNRVYITPNFRGKDFLLPMIKIAGDLYSSIKKQEIIINENLKKYREVESHYNQMGFNRDPDVDDKYFQIQDNKIRLFKMVRVIV